jgi:hypothetical protein
MVTIPLAEEEIQMEFMRMYDVILHWWSFLEIFSLGFTGHPPSRLPGKAALVRFLARSTTKLQSRGY